MAKLQLMDHNCFWAIIDREDKDNPEVICFVESSNEGDALDEAINEGKLEGYIIPKKEREGISDDYVYYGYMGEPLDLSNIVAMQVKGIEV